MIFKGGRWSGNVNGAEITGEKIPGDLANWTALGTDPNQIVNSTYDLLQKRSLTLYHTYGPAASAINKQVQYAIGPGLLYRSQPDWSITGQTPEKAKEWGKKFQKLFHYYSLGVNFYGKQSVLMRGAFTSGDSLLFFDRSDKKNAVDLIDAGGDCINYTKQGTTLGIYHDDLMRRTAIEKTDGSKVEFQDRNGNQNVVQLFFKELPRQMRGMSLVYKIINLAKNHDRMYDATVQRAVLETIMLGYSETDTTNFQEQAKNMAAANKKLNNNQTGDTNIFKKIGNALGLGSGNMFQFKKGENLKFTDLKTPSNNFKPFNDAMIDVIAMVTNTPPEVIRMRYGTSFTAHKGALNNFEVAYMGYRRFFINIVCYPVLREFAKWAILNGMISAPGFFSNDIMQRAYLSGQWIGPVPGAINPLQETNAQIKKVDNAFILRSEAALRSGNDYDNMINEYADEEASFFRSRPENRAIELGKELTQDA